MWTNKCIYHIISYPIYLIAIGLGFEMQGIENIPRYIVADENKLRRILINILSNAIKFTEHGGILVCISAKSIEQRAEDKEDVKKGDKVLSLLPKTLCLLVEVEDTGIGIDTNELDKVFKYFEQTESGRKIESGSGIGMAISQEYARMMDGHITVTSEVGKGSTFRLEVVTTEGEETSVTKKTILRNIIGLKPGQEIPRILVAEDKNESRGLLVKILQAAGFNVKEAVDGKEAINIFRRWHPQFIWMDIRMPVMDGLEATRQIKQTDTGKSTIIAALTAHALEEEKEAILALGCDDFVRKPFREQEIFDVMAKHLNLQYVYEDDSTEQNAGIEDDVQITQQQLATLPPDFFRQLHDAVIELNKERIWALTEQIKEIDANLASALNTCVKKFALSSLLDLLEKIEKPED